MQARLPDINTAFIRFRSEAINALKAQNYDVMHGSLNASNALLPDEYRVIVDDNEYKKLTDTQINYVCTSCDKEIPRENIRIFDLIPDSMESLIYSNRPKKVWNCPKCKGLCLLGKTVIKKNDLQNPSFVGVVPNPPTRQDGLMDRLRFHIEISRWAWLIIGELESRMGIFRDDNWKKGDELLDDNVDTKLEEKDS
jgi:hypothetical protein